MRAQVAARSASSCEAALTDIQGSEKGEVSHYTEFQDPTTSCKAKCRRELRQEEERVTTKSVALQHGSAVRRRHGESIRQDTCLELLGVQDTCRTLIRSAEDTECHGRPSVEQTASELLRERHTTALVEH